MFIYIKNGRKLATQCRSDSSNGDDIRNDIYTAYMGKKEYTRLG